MQKNVAETKKINKQPDGTLVKIFKMMQAQNGLAIADKNMNFKGTELRMLSEIMAAQYNGKRLISTKIADKLGITRSAVSQIVGKLEKEGVVKRVPDAVDRKIAYIEITEDTLKQYETEIKACADYAGKVVEAFGVDKFGTLCAMVDEFCEVADVMKQSCAKKKNK